VSRGFRAVLALALLLQAALLFMELRPSPRALWGDEIMYADLAARWSRGEPAMLDLLWPPLYPHLMSWAQALDGGLVALRLFQVGCLFAAALLWRDLARTFTGSAWAGDVTASLLLLDPQVASFAQFLWPEALHLASFAAVVWILVNRAGRWPFLLLAGALLGACLLAKSVLGPFLPVLLLPLAWEAGARKGLLRAGIVAAACAVVVLPVMAAHARSQGAFVVADGARFNAWVGLNDRSRRNFVDEIVGLEYRRWQESAPTFAGRERLLEEKIRGLVRERGLAAVARAQLGRQYFRLFHHASFFTDQLPGGAIAAQGLGYRGVAPATAAAFRLYGAAVWAIVLAGAGLGLAALPRERRAFVSMLLGFVAYNLALFFVLHVKTRYRVPFLPVLDLLAAAGLAALAGKGTPLGPLLQRIAAAAVAVLALVLAFA
jgi:4-amino-4-deoxy-L-arabinose transferase-like glycosyltransferase